MLSELLRILTRSIPFMATSPMIMGGRSQTLAEQLDHGTTLRPPPTEESHEKDRDPDSSAMHELRRSRPLGRHRQERLPS